MCSWFVSAISTSVASVCECKIECDHLVKVGVIHTTNFFLMLAACAPFARKKKGGAQAKAQCSQPRRCLQTVVNSQEMAHGRSHGRTHCSHGRTHCSLGRTHCSQPHRCLQTVVLWIITYSIPTDVPLHTHTEALACGPNTRHCSTFPCELSAGNTTLLRDVGTAMIPLCPISNLSTSEQVIDRVRRR
jgi:hypothetical protein